MATTITAAASYTTSRDTIPMQHGVGKTVVRNPACGQARVPTSGDAVHSIGTPCELLPPGPGD